MKKEPWRYVVAAISVLYIVYMWVQKDVAGIYAAMAPEQALPLVVSTIAVSLFKVAALAGLILLVKWLVKKCGRQQ